MPAPAPLQTAFIIHPDLSAANRRSVAAMIEEISGLAKAIELEIAEIETFKITQIRPGYFLGQGQRNKAAEKIKALEPDIVIFNHTLSPVQQRNLEKDFNAKVIDRTGLILEIFGARAQTKEGRIQVELAALEYQRSRLVRSWTHLERQRGGAGFMGGPGERQIEIDRRLIGQRITKLKKELEQIRKTRNLGRKARAKVPFPVVALVGYTNAGKSTLFNRLTQENVFAEDLLFATLDPVFRKLTLPGTKQDIILSDTVGFISDLPTHLIAAFRATLEEALDADIIAHVCDLSSPDFRTQRTDVIEILESLGIAYESDPRILEIHNKIDRIKDFHPPKNQRRKNVFPVSALTGQGTDALLKHIAERVSAGFIRVSLDLPSTNGEALSWLYEHGHVIKRTDREDRIILDVSLSHADLARFKEKKDAAMALIKEQ